MNSFLLHLTVLSAVLAFMPTRVIVEGKMQSGIYWSDMMIGTPGQKVRMHDTGSNLNVVEKNGCTGCSHFFDGYLPDSSSSSELIGCSSSRCTTNSCNSNCYDRTVCVSNKCCARLNSSMCAFYVAYGDGSTAEGGLYRDSLSLVGYNDTYTPSVISTVGIVLKEQGSWSLLSDGLLGLAYSNLYCSPSCYNTIIDDLYATYSSEGFRDQFGLCLGDEKGILSIGGIDPDLYVGDIYWMDIQSPSYYTVRISSMSIDTIQFSTRSYSAIIDSGTTLILLPTTLYNAYKRVMQSQFASYPGVSSYRNFFDGYALSTDPSSWPDLEVDFGDFTIQLPPTVYFLYTVQNGVKYWYLGIAAVDSSYVLLGDSFMRGVFVLHDRENDRIGFAVPSDLCFVNHYATIDDFDPRTEPYENRTTVTPSPTSHPISIWDDLEYLIEENFPVICVAVFVVLLCLLFSCYSCKRNKKKILPPRVMIQSNKTMKVAYHKSTTDSEKHTDSAAPSITIPVSPSEKPPMGVPKPGESKTTDQPERLEQVEKLAPVKAGTSVYIQPVAPPKPK